MWKACSLEFLQVNDLWLPECCLFPNPPIPDAKGIYLTLIFTCILGSPQLFWEFEEPWVSTQ